MALRVALVGAGNAGRQHADALDMVDGASVVAVCDTDELPARALASQLGAEVRSWQGILESPTVNAVALCSPPGSRIELALDALGAGKAVVVEKPPALNVVDLERLVDAERSAGRPLAVMLQHRYRLPAAATSEPWSPRASATVEVYRHRPPAYYAARPWRARPAESGGGVFASIAVHYVDLACQLLGTPECVLAHVECSAPGIDARVSLSVRMREGALLAVQASGLARARSERLSVLDGDRQLTITDGRVHYRDAASEFETDPEPTPALRAKVYRELRDALRDGVPARRASAATALGVTGLLERVRALADARDEAPVPCE